MADVLDHLGQPPAVTLEMIREKGVLGGTHDGAFYDWLSDRRNARKIPHRMEECGYEPVRNTGAKDGLWRVKGKRQAIYAKKKMTPPERMKAATDFAEGRR